MKYGVGWVCATLCSLGSAVNEKVIAGSWIYGQASIIWHVALLWPVAGT